MKKKEVTGGAREAEGWHEVGKTEHREGTFLARKEVGDGRGEHPEGERESEPSRELKERERSG